MERMMLFRDPPISLLWPAPPKLYLFTENLTKPSSVVPPEWKNIRRHYLEAIVPEAHELIFYATHFEIPALPLSTFGDEVLDVIAGWMYSDENPLGKPAQLRFSPIVMSKYPARECVGTRADGTRPLVEKIYLIGSRALILGVDSTLEGIKDKRVLEFLMSLQVEQTTPE